MKINYNQLSQINCPVCDSNQYHLLTNRFDSGCIVKCDNCEHIYLNPTLTDEIIDQIYQQYNTTDNEQVWVETIDGWFKDPKGPYQYALNIIQQQENLSEKSILEVGCGPGRFLSACQEAGAKVTGLDPSPIAVRLAKEYFGLEILPKMLEDAIKDGDFFEKRFDFIVSFEVIEHIKKPVIFLKQLEQLLAPGGLLILSTPNFYLYYSMGNKAAVVSQWQEHIQFFEPKTLENCLKAANLEIIEVTTINNLDFGDRQKQIIAKNTLITRIWSKLRNNKLLYSLKDFVFNFLNRQKTETDVKNWNGTCLVSIAQKPKF